MDTSKVLNGNEQIALFMGLHYYSKHPYQGWYTDDMLTRRVGSHDSLSYHHDYRELMLVVEKIERLGFPVDIMGTAVSIYNSDGSAIVDLKGTDYSKKIHAIYEAVIEFINWYTRDLFEYYEEMPQDLKAICDKYFEIDMTCGLSYFDCAEFLRDVQAIGYTFEYYLDASPFNLRKIPSWGHLN